METKNFLGLDGLKRFWEKAKLWIINEITTKIAEIVAEAPEDLDTLKEISDWISTHKDSASAMNSNIIKNQSDINELNNKLSSIEQTNFKAIFDLVRPIGDTYVQYPQQASPMELWGSFSTWQVVNYDGAFFRAEGTNANAFIEKTGNLIKQEQSIQSHKHTINHTHSRGTMDITGQIAGAPCSSSYFYSSYANGAFSLVGWGYGKTRGVDWNPDSSLIANFVASRTWTGETSGPSDNNSGSTGNAETRPSNYTIRIWKRIS